MDFDQTLSALGTVPIPGDAPAGQPARYEPEYEGMQAEIDKLRGLDGAVPDWSLVVGNASLLLATKAKDVLIASYLCAALRETRGWSGFADGLNVIKGLFTTFWEGLQPTRLRVRKAAIDWLLDRCNALVESAPVAEGDREAMTACVAIIDELVAFGDSRWEGDAPTLWSLGKAIKGRIPAETAPVAETPAATPVDNPPRAAGSPAHPATGVTMDAPASRAEAYRAIHDAADLLQAIEPHSPVPYLLRRALAWGDMPLPALYAEMQRSGTVWDLVLHQVPEATAPAAAASIPMAAPTPPPSAPEPPPAPARPRGDF